MLLNNTTYFRSSHRIVHGVILIVGALLLLWPALYNGYPMMNADAGTYLASGFTLETPFDRPITYGLLIRIFSFNGYSLWPLIYTQALLPVALTTAIMRRLVYGKWYLIYAMITTVVLATCTGLPWLVCQVQPDVFTPIALLCIIRIMMGVESKAARVVLYLLYFISVSVHMSHPVIMAGTLVCLYLLRRTCADLGDKLVVRRMAILLLLAAGGIAFMGSALSKSKHVFLMGSLVEKGVLKQYLDDNCARKPLAICAYKDELPTTANEFIWVNSSPLYKVGDWKGSKPEFNAIIHDVFTTPEYLGHFATASAQATGRQLLTFGMGDGNIVFPPESVLSQRVAVYLPVEGRQFQQSKQNRDELLPVFAVPDIVAACVLALSVIVMAAYVWRSAQTVKLITLVCLIGILLNAADNATFSCVQARYGCRVMWLSPFCAMVLIAAKKERVPAV